MKRVTNSAHNFLAPQPVTAASNGKHCLKLINLQSKNKVSFIMMKLDTI